MPAELIGAHMPTAGGLAKAIRAGTEMGCTAIQVFTSSPQQWKAKPISDEMAAEFRAAVAETNVPVVSHDSYLINLCAPDPEKREQSIEGLKRELGRCAQYGIPYTVSHMGAHMGQGDETGLAGVIESAQRVLDESPDDVTLLMETTAGQGSCLNCRFEHLGAILEALGRPERLAVCLDTCHVFAAGYDLRTPEGYEDTFAQFERIVGIDRLKVIHANDSKKPFGSRVDRHANIGEGEIGDECFRLLVNDPRFTHVPIVVETPIENEGHERDIAKLRSFIR